MKYLLTFIFGILLLTSCGAKKSMALHTDRLSLGMTKSEVISVMGEHIPLKMIGSKYYDNGSIAVGQYYDKKLIMGQWAEEIYYLYFLNDELIQWGRPQDWQKEADRIYEIRHR